MTRAAVATGADRAAISLLSVYFYVLLLVSITVYFQQWVLPEEPYHKFLIALLSLSYLDSAFGQTQSQHNRLTSPILPIDRDRSW